MASVALSEAQQQALIRMVKARENLLDFCQFTMPAYQRSPHLEYIARELEKIERGENKRLIVELPPRHGKSTLITVRFPAWYLCRNPSKTVIAASHGDDLATEMGRQARNVVMTQRCFDQSVVGLQSDSKSKHLWHTVKEGRFLAAGTGTAVIGFGGDLICIDDPYGKADNPEGGLSESLRKRIQNWYVSEIIHRMEPGCAMVIVMHRWHEADLIGWLLDTEGEASQGGKWTVCRLPAIAEESDPIGRRPGEPLWPSRYPVSELEMIRRPMSESLWNSLYQQRPAPEEGAIFKHLGEYEYLPDLKMIYVSVDAAYGLAADADFYAWAGWGWDGYRAYLLEAGHLRGDPLQAEKRATAFAYKLHQKYSVPVRGLHRRAVGIDTMTAMHLSRGVSTVGVSNPGRMGIPMTPVKLPKGASDRAWMASMITAEFESERALVPSRTTPQYGTWLREWKEEHVVFDHGKNDDFVETTITALWYLFRSKQFKRPAPKKLWGRR